LSRAAAAGKIDAVSTLLSARVDVNAENHMGERPLMLAAAGGHSDIVDGLLRRGADLTATTRGGDTALALATRGCHQQVVKLLLDHRADARAALDRGITPLMAAAATCPSDLVELLIAARAQVDAVDERRRTAMCLRPTAATPAAYLRCSNTTPTSESPTTRSNAAAQSARKWQRRRSRLLMGENADLDARTMAGNTPLYSPRHPA